MQDGQIEPQPKNWGDPYKSIVTTQGFEMGENRRFKQRVFKFNEKPADDVIAALKENGFTYRAAEKAWTITANPDTRKLSDELAAQFAARARASNADEAHAAGMGAVAMFPASSGLNGAGPGHRRMLQNGPSPPACQPEMPVLRLPWDFKTTFPIPTDEAVDAGRILDEDTTPESVRSIHDEHAREALATLRALDAVLDARRRGIDPATGAPPRTAAGKERLTRRLHNESERLEHSFTVLMDVYEEAFGFEARGAFAKAIRAWHAGVEVAAESTARSVTSEIKTPELAPESVARRVPRHDRPRRIPARLPVPKPLAAAIAAGRFGQEENGKPVRPGPHEVRDITEQHAETHRAARPDRRSAQEWQRRVAGILQNALAAYAEDFGQPATDQLEAYVRRQASLDRGSRRGR